MSGTGRPTEHERVVDADGVRLVVTEAGPSDGPAVLLLHGFPDSRRSWRHLVPALAGAGYRVLAPDLRGYGDSDAPADVDAYRLSRLRADVVAVLDDRGVRQAAVVGHDWGSVLGWSFAAAHPDRTAALVAVSVGHPRARAAGGPAQLVRGLYVWLFLVPGLAERLLPRRSWWALRRGGWDGAHPGDDPDLQRQLADLSRPGRLTAALAWYRANIRLPWRLPRGATTGPRPDAAVTGRPARRHEVTCPVMGVWSTRDPALVERQMTASRRHVAGTWRYEKLVGVDHWVPSHAPRSLARLVLDFLRSERYVP